MGKLLDKAESMEGVGGQASKTIPQNSQKESLLDKSDRIDADPANASRTALERSLGQNPSRLLSSEKGYFSKLGDIYSETRNNVVEDVKNIAGEQVNKSFNPGTAASSLTGGPLSANPKLKLIGDVGSGIMKAGAANIDAAFHLLPESIRKPVTDLIAEAGNSEEGKKATKSVVDFANNLAGAWKNFESAAPGLAQNIKSTANVAGGLATVEGGAAVGKPIAEAIDAAGAAVGKKAGQAVGKLSKGTGSALDSMPLVDKATAGEAAALGSKGATSKGLISSPKVIPQAEDIAREAAIAPYVEVTETLPNKITQVKQGITDFSEKNVKPFLKSFTKPYSQGDIAGAENSIRAAIPEAVKGDKEMVKLYENVMKVYSRTALKQPELTAESLWKARIEADNIIKNQFGDAVLSAERRGVRDAAIRKVRQTYNDLIGQLSEDATFKAQMKQLNRMYEAQDNFIARQTEEILKGGSQAKDFLKSPAGAAAAGAASAVGVGTGLWGIIKGVTSGD